MKNSWPLRSVRILLRVVAYPLLVLWIATVLAVPILWLWQPQRETTAVDEPTLAAETSASDIPVTSWAPAHVQPSPLDRLDPERIPFNERSALEPPGLVAVLGSPSRWPSGSVAPCVVCSPDGKWILSGHFDGRIRFWEAKTLRLVDVFETGQISIQALTFSPDSQTLVSLQSRGNLRLWDVTAPQPRERIARLIGPKIDDSFFQPDLSFCSEGKALAETASAENSFRLWDLSGTAPVECAVVAGQSRPCPWRWKKSTDERGLVSWEPAINGLLLESTATVQYTDR